MTAWFEPERISLFAFVAFISTLTLLEKPAERGEHRGLVLSICAAAVLAGIACLLTSVIAARSLQARYVFLTLAGSGALVTISSTLGFLRLLRMYRAAGRQRAAAQPTA
jgi:hypothetical protein